MRPAGSGPDAAIARRHAWQRALAWWVAPLWVPLAAAVLRFGLGYRIRDAERLRKRYRELTAGGAGPILLCANHLTLIDSFLVGWALGSPGWYLRQFDRLPWNTPEATNFAFGAWSRVASYLGKCIPVVRGGKREEVAAVLAQVVHLLERGEVALMFPEGGRSRSGRVDVDAAAWGVGRVVAAVEGCRVLCVYLRGERQETWSSIPARGERFHVELSCIEPKTDLRGARGSRELARQITAQLARMEEEYFDARQ